MVTLTREKNLKGLLMRGHPYYIKKDSNDHSKHGYKRCNKIYDSCDNFVLETDHIISNATGERYTIKKDFTCTSKLVIYCAICTKCTSQGVGSRVIWKPRLANYKYHISKKVESCCISKHFIRAYTGGHNLGHIKFIILDKIDNIDNLSEGQIEDLLLQKETFWIGTFVTQHQGMNGTHDWNRTQRRDKINNKLMMTWKCWRSHAIADVSWKGQLIFYLVHAVKTNFSVEVVFLLQRKFSIKRYMITTFPCLSTWYPYLCSGIYLLLKGMGSPFK